MLYSCKDIARYFVLKEAMDHEKLQALLYLSYAYFLTLNHALLFKTEGFEALPVMPAEMSIFNAYHHLGKKKIKSIEGTDLPEEICLFLDSIYINFGAATSSGLIAFVRHSEPFLKARQRQDDLKIHEEDMIAYYGK